MARTYERNEKHYDFKLLTHLVETGQAKFYEGPGIYVLKTEDGTVAVRPHQVFFTPDPAPFTLVVEERVASPMDGYFGKEEFDGEDTGPGGVVYDSALALAEQVLARRGDTTTDPLSLVRRMLDDRSCESQLREELDNTPQKASTSWVSASEQDEILGYFGI